MHKHIIFYYWYYFIVDYILIFVGKVDIKINEDEVDDVKYVTKNELENIFKKGKKIINKKAINNNHKHISEEIICVLL